MKFLKIKKDTMVLLTQPFSLSPGILLFSQKLVTFCEYQVSVLFLLISILLLLLFLT